MGQRLLADGPLAFLQEMHGRVDKGPVMVGKLRRLSMESLFSRSVATASPRA